LPSCERRSRWIVGPMSLSQMCKLFPEINT